MRFLRLQVFVDFGQRADQPIGLGGGVLRELGHVAVAEGYAHAQAAGGFGGENIVGGVAHHQHIGGGGAEHFGGVQQRQRAGFFFGQAVAAEYQAEIVGQVQLLEQLGCQHFVFVGNHRQRNAQRSEQSQAGFGFGVGAGEHAQVFAVVADKESKRLLPAAWLCLTVAAVGENAVDKAGDAVADIVCYGVFGQRRQTHVLAGGVGGSGKVGHGIAERAVQIKGNGLNMFDGGYGHGGLQVGKGIGL